MTTYTKDGNTPILIATYKCLIKSFDKKDEGFIQNLVNRFLGE